MKVIRLENINNVRDLGGTKTKDGRSIIYNRLIRGCALHSASDKDIEILVNQYNLAHVHDFRTYNEIEEKPHPKEEFKGVEYHFTPVVNEIKTVLARDKKSNKLTLDAAKCLSKEDAMKDMQHFYRIIPCLEEAKFAYKTLLHTLLNNEKGAVYWHCSMGKDRCGIGSFLVEYTLGVSIDDIKKDYLDSNTYLKDNVVKNMMKIVNRFPFEINKDAFMCFQITHPSYLQTTLDEIENKWDCIENFLDQELDFDKNKIEKLKDKYLE